MEIRNYSRFYGFLITCKNEEDPIKNEGNRMVTVLYIDFFRRSRAGNSVVSSGVWPKSELIQAFIIVFVICKNKEDPYRNECARVVTTFFQCKSMGILQTLKAS